MSNGVSMRKDYLCAQDFNDFITNEINYHIEYKEPWYIKWFCKLVRLNTPKECVIGELEFFQLYVENILEWEMSERNKYIPWEEVEKELGLS